MKLIETDNQGSKFNIINKNKKVLFQCSLFHSDKKYPGYAIYKVFSIRNGKEYELMIDDNENNHLEINVEFFSFDCLEELSNFFENRKNSGGRNRLFFEEHGNAEKVIQMLEQHAKNIYKPKTKV